LIKSYIKRPILPAATGGPAPAAATQSTPARHGRTLPELFFTNPLGGFGPGLFGKERGGGGDLRPPYKQRESGGQRRETRHPHLPPTSPLDKIPLTLGDPTATEAGRLLGSGKFPLSLHPHIHIKLGLGGKTPLLTDQRAGLGRLIRRAGCFGLLSKALRVAYKKLGRRRSGGRGYYTIV